MIIDLHRHTIAPGWMTDSMWQLTAMSVAQAFCLHGRQTSQEEAAGSIMPSYCDLNGELHLKAMDRAGIQTSALFVFDLGPELEPPPVSILEQNQAVFEIARTHPERIIPFAALDPRRKDAAGFYCRAADEWGVRGLKLHPGSGFDPKGPEALELMQCVARQRHVTLVHTGPNSPPSSSEFASPLHLEPMLQACPDTPVIAAHLSLNHRRELYEMAPKYPNLYADFSAWQQVARQNYARFAAVVHEAVSVFGPERIVFGTDAPFRWPSLDDRAFVTAVQDLATEKAGPNRLDQGSVELILGGNAQRLLGL